MYSNYQLCAKTCFSNILQLSSLSLSLQLKECIALSRDWNWPDSAKTTETNPATDFYEGHFLQILFDRIARILEQVE